MLPAVPMKMWMESPRGRGETRSSNTVLFFAVLDAALQNGASPGDYSCINLGKFPAVSLPLILGYDALLLFK